MANQNIVAQRAILNHRVGPDLAACTYLHAAQQLHKRLNHRVGRNLNFRIDHRSLGPEDGNALRHQPICGVGAEGSVQGNQLRNGVRAQNFVRIGGLNGHHAFTA